jgi:poly(A) polymerase
MQLNADWLNSPAPVTVFNLLNDAGYQAYFVGGCVRDALLGVQASDLDLATDALPEMVVKLAKAKHLRVIPTGIEHGTVTVVVGNQPLEITTFRKDTQTDGRRAVVAFSTSIKDDAIRRDFTMNALYADIDGTVIDPLGGLPDLQANRVKFIENPTQRIREDYLRILRFFRFHAHYGDPIAGIDADALDACAKNLDGIDSLSKERIGHEMRKLLSANDPAPSIAAMAQTGVLARIITGANPTSLAPLIHLEKTIGAEPNWMRRLLALGGQDMQNALRLSKHEARLLSDLHAVVSNANTPRIAAHKLGAEAGMDAILVLHAHLGTVLPDALNQELNIGEEAQFPIAAVDLTNRYEGAALGACLKKLQAAWIASNLRATKQDLLAIDEKDHDA